jgi:C4-dicarboxylate-specific signal transduction histidine kinase
MIQSHINRISEYINNKNLLTNDFLKEDIKHQVYIAHNMMTSIYNEFKDTRTKEEITLIIKTALKNIKFNKGRGYYFIYDLDGVGVFHPVKTEREGINLFNAKDINGTYIIQESINIAKSEKQEGYQIWMFDKPNGLLKEYEKIGFIKKFEPYNWFIGVGEYVEDFENEIKNEVVQYIKDLGYKDAGYVFLIDKKGDFLLTKTEFTNVRDMDKKNSFIEPFNDFINSENKYTFLEYKLLDDSKKYSGKISYLKKIEKYDWVIGTGFNLDNLNSKIEEKQIALEKDHDKRIYSIFIVAIAMTALFLLLSIFISKLLKKKFLEYKENLEKQIIENHNQKETLLRAQEVAHIGDWKLNLQTNKAYWSNEIIKIFGLPEIQKDAFGPEYLKSIMIDEDIPCFENSLNNCISTGSEHKCIYRIKRTDNEIRWIECRGKLEKDKLSILGTVQDITENKNLEIEKKQNDELLYQQSKMAAMGEMIGNIAHQWRQPLSIISTASTGTKLQKEMNCLSDEELYSALVTINASAQYLSTVIDDFKNFFNPSNNKIREFNIVDTFNKTLNLVKSQFISNNIEVIINIEEFKILSIENELIQVLINILNNSRDVLLTKENQKKLIFINTCSKDNSLYIEIKDNAGGIEENIIGRIFEPYFTTKHKSQGTGIGLYMSKEIIEKHLEGSLFVSNDNYIFEDMEYSGANFKIRISNMEI